MGTGVLRRLCVQGEEEQQKQNHYLVLAGDYKKFEGDRWYTFQNPMLFDPNKFIFLYPNYQEEQSRLLQRWKATIDIKNIEYGESRNEEDVVSTRWKYAIKRGVPVEYFRTIISVIFNRNFNNLKPAYDKLKNETNFNDKIPLFGSEESTLKQAVHAPFLNEKGFAVLRDLLFLFKKKKGETFHNRYLVHITALLLVFFEDYQTYELVSTMMDESSNMSLNRVQSLRWHIVFKEEQMKNLAVLFYNVVGTNSQTVGRIEKHLDRNKIDKIKLFTKVVQNLFYGFLPFPLILRVFILFLNEGVKMFFRVFYAILAYAERKLDQATSLDKALLVIRRECLRLSNTEGVTLLKNSFNLNLKANLSAKLVESRIKKQQSERKYYFLPFIQGTSYILSFDDLEVIWGFLPFELKTYDLQLRFPLEQTEDEKLHVNDMLKSLEGSKFSLIMIKTTTDSTFGCFFIGSPRIEQQSGWYGNNLSFVFMLTPKAKKYASTRENNQFLFTGKDQFKMGSGGAGSAIELKETLEMGLTHKCNTFRNEPLNNGMEGQFQIKYIEAFTLV